MSRSLASSLSPEAEGEWLPACLRMTIREYEEEPSEARKAALADWRRVSL